MKIISKLEMQRYAKQAYPQSRFEDVVSWMQQNNYLVVVNRGHSGNKKYCVMDYLLEKSK